MIKQLALVFIGGGLGSSLRFIMGKYLNDIHSGIPYGTFIANILGSLLIGVILGLALKQEAISYNMVLLIGVGFCGGFTTFSSFAYENHLFLQDGNFLLFFLYTILTFIVGFAAVFLGMWLVK
jgi:CrcB protein